jgi:iron-sulfur cluster assembly protein
MIQLTPPAAEQILRAVEAQQDDTEQASLRIAAKIEDGEIVYGMGFDDERENDVVIETNGIRLVIAPRSQELLDGTTLDFVELRPGEFQFIFVNPNEVPPTGGGCGTPKAGGGGGGCGSCGSKSGGGCS